MHHAVDKHFRGDIEPLVERLAVAGYRHLLVGERGDSRAVVAVVLLAQDAGIGHRIPEGTDTDLQGTAVSHQRAGVQSGGVILYRYRHIGHRKQGFVVCAIAHQQVEGIDANLRIMLHEGQVGVHLADGNTGLAGPGVHFHQLRSGVGITGQAHRKSVGGLARRNQLHQDIGAGVKHIPGDMGVVTGDVIALCGGHVLHRPGLEIQLTHLDVGGQGVAAHGLDESQLFIVTKQALHDGPRELGFHAGTQGRLFQAQRRVDMQGETRVGRCPMIKRVDQLYRFTQPQRRHQYQFFTDPGDRPVYRRFHCRHCLCHRPLPDYTHSLAATDMADR